MLRRIQNIILRFTQFLPFGIISAFKYALILPYFIKNNEKDKYYHAIIDNYLTNLFKQIQIKPEKRIREENVGPIWVCWWQGEENMPAIVRSCWYNINKNIKSRPKILVTEDNYANYVEIPEIFKQRLKSNEISITHFSDILRSYLLFQKGGYWLDATIFINKPTDVIFDKHSFLTLSIPYTDKYFSKGRWSGFLLGGQVGHPLFKFMTEAYYKYWTKHRKVIDYFLMDYIINIAYNVSTFVRNDIDNKALICPNLYKLQHSLDLKFNENTKNLCDFSPFHKLTWKFNEQKPGRNTVREWLECNPCL